ncbi:MAG TPA: radical SAM family heme chaperone HemW [Acidimicrobiales bacterium]|nr:radical SAM family heme chaperone HemW [Acidimicrobiales bacterium]
MLAEPFGVYVHLPFCAHKCDFCAFATYEGRDALIAPYVAGCRTELDRAAAAGELPAATSVYLGGGTPSRLSAAQLTSLVGAVDRAAGAEVNVECHPEDVDADFLAELRASGVTRLSLGVQSTRAHVLRALDRRGTPDTVLAAAELVAAAGFSTWSVDLIFGASGESDDDWAATLDDVLGLASPPPHLSTYALGVEPGTPLAADAARHPDPDAQARRYRLADERLGAAGYRWEEISNWAKPGHECRHNHLYWEQGPYRGIGSGAHSHRAGRRWWNVRTPERYLAQVTAGASPVAGEEVLDDEQRAAEALSLSLRTPAGVPEAALADAPELAGLVERRAGRAVLTVRGRLVADELTLRLGVAAEGASILR